jgi:hypothetical protein
MKTQSTKYEYISLQKTEHKQEELCDIQHISLNYLVITVFDILNYLKKNQFGF